MIILTVVNFIIISIFLSFDWLSFFVKEIGLYLNRMNDGLIAAVFLNIN